MVTRRCRGGEGKRDVAIGIRDVAAVERHGAAMLRPPALVMLVTAAMGYDIDGQGNSLPAHRLADAGTSAARVGVATE